MRTNRRDRRKRGSTMVEVLVAFAMVLLVLAAFARTVTVSARLLTQSNIVKQANEELNRSYYQESEQEGASRESVSGELVLIPKQGTTGAVKLSRIRLNRFEKQGAGVLYYAAPISTDEE